MEIKKIFIFILLLLGMISLSYSATADYPYDVANATYTGYNIDTTAQQSTSTSLRWNNNGSSLYVSGSAADQIRQYSCTIAFNTSTCSYASKLLAMGSQESNLQGFDWNVDGSSIYGIGYVSDKIHQYNCTTNFDVSTCSYTNQFLSILSEDGDSSGVSWNTDGSKVYMVGYGNDKIHQYSCTINFDIDSCSYDSKFLSVTTEDTVPHDLRFNNNGSKVYIVGSSSDKVHQYSCTSNTDISTCNYDDRFLDVSSQSTTPAGLSFDNEGRNVYINGYIQDVVYQYNINFTDVPSIGITIDDISLINNSWQKNDFNISLNISQTGTNDNINTSYSIDGGALVQFGTNTLRPNVTISIAALSEANHTIWFNATNNETSTSEGNYTFLVDKTPPVIDKIGNYTTGAFEINFSTIYNVTDSLSGLSSCLINITELENVTTPDNFLINCTDTQVFNTSGLHNAFVTAIDNAGNIATRSDNFTIAPTIQVFFADINTSIILNYTSIIYHPDGRIEPGIINSEGATLLSPVNNGSLDLGIHNITFAKEGYLTQNVSVNVTENSANQNFTFNMTNSIVNIFIKDKITGETINTTTFNMEVIGPVGFNTNTSNGTASITNTFLVAGDYTLAVSGTNYNTETLLFSFNNREVLNLTVFMSQSNATTTGTVVIKCVDKFGKAVTGATVQALQWVSSTSSYNRVSEGTITEDGQSTLGVILDTKQYIFTCFFQEFAANSTAQFIPTSENGKIITLRLSPGATTEFRLFQNLLWNVTDTFNETSLLSDIDFEWRTLDGRDIQGCVIYYRLYANGAQVELDRDCVTSSQTTLMSNKIINTSIDTLASIGFIEGGTFFEVDYIIFYSDLQLSTVLELYNFHYYTLVFIMMIAVIVGVNTNPLIGGTGVIFSSGTLLYLVPGFVNKGVVAFLMFIGMSIIIGGNKKK